ncbi:MAG: DUF4249 domain-containing protein [Chlorobi bacterium]|nr:DUF4249 domain-containing protein [Chlorobiota bacterium]
MNRILLIAGIFFVTLTSCIDPYVLNLNDYESLLVVDGLITNEAAPYTIKLSRTFQDKDTLPVMVSKAVVTVMDKNGVVAAFREEAPGIYRSDPDLFVGETGNTYILHIKTVDGLEYESSPCYMSPVPDIDSIFFTPDNAFFDNGTKEETGIRIFINTGRNDDNCKYFRWEYEEVWKFKTSYPAAYQYLGGRQVISIPVKNHVCWEYRDSKDILIHSVVSQQTDQITGMPLKFIAPARSDRLTLQYSIRVKQYSLSKQEYEFWNNLKQVSEGGGDIFDRQPFSVTGNIRCLNRQDKKVLGYFSVSAAKQKRKYITRNDIKDLNLPNYRYPCTVVQVESTPTQSIENIYNLYTGMGYVFAYPIYTGLSLTGMAFTTKECSDCSLNGDTIKPDFWVDMP